MDLPQTSVDRSVTVSSPSSKVQTALATVSKKAEHCSPEPLAQKSLFSEFSISLALKKKEDGAILEHSKEKEALPQQHFTQTDLEKAWLLFLNSLKIENSVAFYAIRNFGLKKINENTIEISYSSESAKKEFESIQAEFFNHFKHKVNNYSISLNFKQDEDLIEETITPKKTFERFAEVNPLLNDLNQLMGFDLN